jgi:hypothetical protein
MGALEVAPLNATDSEPSERVNSEIVGAVGGPEGTSSSDSAEYALSPALLVAFTLNLYAVPFARPVISHVVSVPEQLVAEKLVNGEVAISTV